MTTHQRYQSVEWHMRKHDGNSSLRRYRRKSEPTRAGIVRETQKRETVSVLSGIETKVLDKVHNMDIRYAMLLVGYYAYFSKV